VISGVASHGVIMPLTMSDGNQLCHTPDQHIPRVEIFYCRENGWLGAINLHCDGWSFLGAATQSELSDCWTEQSPNLSPVLSTGQYR
jgi:hypothetical protein